MIALAKPMVGIEEKTLENEINSTLNILVTGAGSVYGHGIIRSLKESVQRSITSGEFTNTFAPVDFSRDSLFLE